MEQRLLAFARTRRSIDRIAMHTAAYAQPSLSHRPAGDLHALMAPVEMVSLARFERQRVSLRGSIFPRAVSRRTAS